MSNLDFFRDPVTGRLYGPDTFADNETACRNVGCEP